MQRIAFIILTMGLTAGLLATASGCVTTRLVGHDRASSGRFMRDVGVTGNRTNLTIESGSKVPKLSIIGDDCTVTIEEGADVGRIEFWGNGCTVSLPADMMVYVSQAGANKIVHRPRAGQ